MSTITETQLKLRDAGIQMKLAIDNIGDEEVFRSCVNAYILAARSIFDVMKEESLGNDNLMAWYSSTSPTLMELPIVRFFGKQREITMHRGVVKPNTLSVPIRNIRMNGQQVSPHGTMWVWLFDSVQDHLPEDQGNVPRLCEQYFLILKQFVHAWLQQRDTVENN